LDAVADDTASSPLSVLAGRIAPALDRALLLETAIALEEELHALAPTEPADRSGVTCHVPSPRLVFSPTLRGLQSREDALEQTVHTTAPKRSFRIVPVPRAARS